ncbi:MAG: hypothetical protein ACTHU0_19125 [Kofleriaceae bacterium]
MPLYRSPEGRTVDVPEADAAWAQSQGFTPVDAEQRFADLEAEAAKPDDRGLVGTINAGATGFLSGLTLGGSDVLLGSLMTGNERDQLRDDRRANPGVTAAAEIGGGLAASFAAPGSALARTPAGALAQLANQGQAAARAVGGIRGAAGVATITGFEGAAQSAGMYLSDVALGDRELTAEGMAGALGRGFGFGTAVGGAAYGIEKGTMAARRMFARSESGARAAELAEQTWKSKSDEVLSAGDQTADIAKARLREIQVQKEEAALARARIDIDIAKSRAEAQAGFDAARNDTLLAREQARTAEQQARQTLAEERVTAFRDKQVAKSAPKGKKTQPSEVAEIAPSMARTDVASEASARGEVRAAADAADGATQLERQLQEMQARTAAGETIQDLNAARTQRPRATAADDLGPEIAAEETKLSEAVAEYDTAKQRVQAWIDRIKNPRTKQDMTIGAGPSAISRGRSYTPLADDVFVEQSGGKLWSVGDKGGKLTEITPNSRILAAPNGPDFRAGQQLDEAYEDAIELARLADEPADRALALQEAVDIERQIHAYVRSHNPRNAAVIDQIEAAREAAGRTALEAAELRVTKRLERDAAVVDGPYVRRAPGAEEQAFEAALAKSEPLSMFKDRATSGIAGEIDDAAKVLDDYERASAKLTEAVGEAAPKSAQDAAAAYRKAETEVERRHVDRTVRAIDDVAGEGGKATTRAKTPRRSGNPRLDELEVQRAEADLRYSNARAAEAEARAESARAVSANASREKAIDVVSLPGKPQAQPGRLGRAADALGVVELLGGIPGLPSPRSIPLVGPLLADFLKYRTLAGRLMGRVPATGEARAASLASKTKDRVAVSVDRMLGLIERNAGRAARPTVTAGSRVVDALSRRIHDDGEPDAPSGASAQELAAVRAREVVAYASNSRAIIADVRRQMRDVADPDLIAAAEQQQLRKYEYLARTAPKAPPPNPLNKRPWTPTPAQTTAFARRLEVADNPVRAFEQVEEQCLTPEAAETLRVVYPRLFASAQQRLLERAGELRQSVPYPQLVRMSLLFDVPLDQTLNPETIASLQSVYAANSPTVPTQQPGSPPTPAVASNTNLTALYQTGFDRRAAQR